MTTTIDKIPCVEAALLAQLQSLDGFELDDSWGFGQTSLFFVRIWDDDDHFMIEFGEQKTFDRWSNSINFRSRWSKDLKHYRPDIRLQYQWMLKVLKSGLFDFSKYSSRIELPWLGEFRLQEG